MEIVWRFLKKLNTELQCEPAMPPLGVDGWVWVGVGGCGVYPKKMGMQMVVASLFTTAKRQEKCKLS